MYYSCMGWEATLDIYARMQHDTITTIKYVECLDRNVESIPGSYANTNGGLFYHVDAKPLEKDYHVYKSISLNIISWHGNHRALCPSMYNHTTVQISLLSLVHSD